MKKNKIVNGKIVITTMCEFELLKSMMTKEAFFSKYILSMNLVSKIAAKDAMANASFWDVSPVYLSKAK